MPIPRQQPRAPFGYHVVSEDPDLPDLAPPGRVCSEPGCGTELCRYNLDPSCFLHGGWTGLREVDEPNEYGAERGEAERNQLITDLWRAGYNAPGIAMKIGGSSAQIRATLSKLRREGELEARRTHLPTVQDLRVAELAEIHVTKAAA